MGNKNTKFIAIGNQKGGVGKSTVTSLVANYIHLNTDYSVCVIDADDLQQSLTGTREEDEKGENYNEDDSYNLVHISAADFPKYYSNFKGEFDVVFVDLPGTLDNPSIINCYSLFDFVFIPTRVSTIDLKSTLQFIKLFDDNVKPKRTNGDPTELHVFLNDIDINTHEFKEYRENFEIYPFKSLKSYLSHTVFYQRSLSTTEISENKRLTKEVSSLCNEILSIIK